MKVASRLLVLLLILSVLFSVVFVALESGHDCHGEENCPICKILATLSWVMAALCLPLLLLLGFLQAERQDARERKSSSFITPIRLKVKLLN